MKVLALLSVLFLVGCGSSSGGSGDSGGAPTPVTPSTPCVKSSYSVVFENQALGTIQSAGGLTTDAGYASFDHTYQIGESYTASINACSVSRLFVALQTGYSVRVSVYKNNQLLDQRVLTGFIQYDYNVAGL